MNNDQLLLVGSVAQKVARVWPDCSPEDLRQELCLFWMEAAAREGDGTVTVLTYWKDLEADDNRAKLNRALINAANKWCRKETAAVRGNDDYVKYDRYTLRQMLPSLYRPEEWGSLSVSGAGGKSPKLAREGGDSLAAYADLTRAWNMLKDDERFCLLVRYVWEEADWQELIEERFGCTEAAAKQRVVRAMDSLERALAGKPLSFGPLDRRTVVSNASAQSSLAHSYDG